MNKINQYDSIGFLASPSLNSKALRKFLTDFQEECKIDLGRKEIVLNSIDTETAQKYGLFRTLENSRVFATISNRIVNFYNDYGDLRYSLKEMLEYLYNKCGCIIMLQDPDNVIEINEELTEEMPDVYSYDTEMPSGKKLKPMFVEHKKLY